ncbi:MAG: FAD-dependent oxidoreductase [Nitrososphaeria archaeon]|nr:FAD-dependent oxidoreductase [Nitrososphaeria archaeon]NIQ32844.1 FAD-dependent oxidoreductase [Nitrososphaeria archaeon]
MEIKLNLNVTPRLVKEMGPEAIIVATGSLPPVPDFPVTEAANVMSAWDVLSSDLAVGEKIVVVGGGAIGVETADFLVARGKRVTILEAKDRIALDLDRTIRWIVLRRLHQGKAVILTNTRPKRVIDGRVIVEAEEGEKEIFADMTVLASSPRPNNKLRGKLEDLVGEVYYVGDCVVPRTALEAIREGYDAAGKI